MTKKNEPVVDVYQFAKEPGKVFYKKGDAYHEITGDLAVEVLKYLSDISIEEEYRVCRDIMNREFKKAKEELHSRPGGPGYIMGIDPYDPDAKSQSFRMLWNEDKLPYKLVEVNEHIPTSYFKSLKQKFMHETQAKSDIRPVLLSHQENIIKEVIRARELANEINIALNRITPEEKTNPLTENDSESRPATHTQFLSELGTELCNNNGRLQAALNKLLSLI